MYYLLKTTLTTLVKTDISNVKESSDGHGYRSHYLPSDEFVRRNWNEVIISYFNWLSGLDSSRRLRTCRKVYSSISTRKVGTILKTNNHIYDGRWSRGWWRIARTSLLMSMIMYVMCNRSVAPALMLSVLLVVTSPSMNRAAIYSSRFADSIQYRIK